ncbi:MAG: malonate--CoA ligase [Alphaproteobacteria bacterium]
MSPAVPERFDGNLYALFRQRFPADRARPFIQMVDGRVHDYAALEAISGRYARLLQSLGAANGERVLVQVEKSPEALFLYLAALRAGAIYVPLNTAYRAHELEHFIGDAEPRVVVCDPASAETIRKLAKGAEVLTLDARGQGTLAERSANLDPAVEPARKSADDVAAILYTSGTTGRSKGAMLTHWNLASNALTLHALWGFRPNDVLLHALPIFHTHGLFVATNCVLLNGTKMIFLPKFDSSTVIRLLKDSTVLMGVPTFYVRLLAEAGFGAEQCRTMRLFIAGSAPLLEETFKEFARRTGHTILERYGMTEAGMITSNPLDGERIAGSVGPPLPGVEVRVADDKGTPLPQGEAGVLEIRGPNVFKGYWRMPEKTREEFRTDGFFITGDVSRIDSNGYVAIVGRAKDLIISGGFNVYPKEIELQIDAIDGVAESAVIGLPHPDFGEGVAAVATLKPGASVTEEAVIGRLKDDLANFKVPKRVFFVADLPRNAMGKVQKNILRDTYKDTFRP